MKSMQTENMKENGIKRIIGIFFKKLFRNEITGELNT
jgi:hypothetical protein